jgi:hypothetical protein
MNYVHAVALLGRTLTAMTPPPADAPSLSFSLTSGATTRSTSPRRVHIVCPSNGACTAVALVLCELLNAGCASDFSCLMAQFYDGHHLFKVLDRSARHTRDVLAKWRASRANLVVKNTISAQAPDVLRTLDEQAQLPSSAQPSYAAYRRVQQREAVRASGVANGTNGIFTHHVLFLRDPVAQYLSVRSKAWCANCGGFLPKLAVQESLLRRCLAASRATEEGVRSVKIARAAPPADARRGTGRSGCPFDVVLFDRDVYAAVHTHTLPVLFERLGLLPAGTAGNITDTGVRIRFKARRARNEQLGMGGRLINRGNMQGPTLHRYIMLSHTMCCATWLSQYRC